MERASRPGRRVESRVARRARGPQPGYRRIIPPLLNIIEASLTVANIAETQLKRVNPRWTARHAAKWLRKRSLDVAPVEEDPIRRYVAAEDLVGADGTVNESAQPIDASHLVTADLPLAHAIELLRHVGFFFVIEGSQLVGIVTRADVQKMPVSMVTLSLLLATEAAFDRIIKRSYGDSWFDELSPGRKRKLEQTFESRKRYNAEITRQECLQFADRIDLIRNLEHEIRELGFGSKTAFGKRMKQLERLRNELAHGRNLLDAEPDPAAAIALFVDVKDLAKRAWLVRGRSGSQTGEPNP